MLRSLIRIQASKVLNVAFYLHWKYPNQTRNVGFNDPTIAIRHFPEADQNRDAVGLSVNLTAG
jgi:hypothetical protein